MTNEPAGAPCNREQRFIDEERDQRSRRAIDS
jgi:hypothetical protein